MSYPIDETSAKIGQLNFQGNIIPASWKDFIRLGDKPDPVAMMILAEIVYWYRPILTRDDSGAEVYHKKYREDILQKSYKQLEKATGFSVKQIREALIRLECLKLIKRHLRTIDLPLNDDCSRKLPNILFIEIFPEVIKEITFPSVKKRLSLPAGKDTPTPKEIPTSTEGKTITETTSKTTSEIKGNDYEAMPFSYEKEVSVGRQMFPLKKHQQHFFDKMKVLDMGIDDCKIVQIVRRYTKDQSGIDLLDKAISHIENEIYKGTEFIKDKICMFNSVLSGKISPISRAVKENSAVAKEIKDKLSWASLLISEKFVLCESSRKEVHLDQEKLSFVDQLKKLYELSRCYG